MKGSIKDFILKEVNGIQFEDDADALGEFLQIKINNEDFDGSLFASSNIVTKLWNIFVLDSFAYTKFCNTYCGGKLMEFNQPANDIELAYVRTYLLLSYPSLRYWPIPKLIKRKVDLCPGERHDKMITVYIVDESDKRTKYWFSLTNDIRSVREFIAHKTGSFPKHLLLFKDGMLLQDSFSLLDYDVNHKSTLQLREQ